MASSEDKFIGRTGKIGPDQVKEALKILADQKVGKQALENRIVDNERWFKLRHWETMRVAKKSNDPEPASAWLLNALANKHADATDNFPAPIVLPREESDVPASKILSEIVPVVLEQAGYDQTYNDVWWYKLKNGTGVTGVFWDQKANNGLGEIELKYVDLINLFWDPFVMDIQKSKNMFYVQAADRDDMDREYPFLVGKSNQDEVSLAKYVFDETDPKDDKVLVIDWYYKTVVEGKQFVHYCKFCLGEVIYASENDPLYKDTGYYWHGKYPFDFDVMFPDIGSPAGFGYIDVCKSPQLFIDKLDSAILKNAIMSAKPRWFRRVDGNVNMDQYKNWDEDFVDFTGNDPRENLLPIVVPTMPTYCVTVRRDKVDELKETAGNRDFSQGSTAQGVTAASAIAALQEAGSKLSRDIIKSSYRSFARVVNMVIDLMRQHYDQARYFRILGDNGTVQFKKFDNSMIGEQEFTGVDGEVSSRLPVFDIRVVAQKTSPFSTVAQNERAKELYSMGFFRPDMADQALVALDMMDFEGIDKIKERIAQNSIIPRLQQLAEVAFLMASALDSMRGTNEFSAKVLAIMGETPQLAPGQPSNEGASRGEVQPDALGNIFNTARNNTSGAARTQAARTATPKV